MPPTTVPDEVVSIVLNISFNIQPENLERIKEEHRFSMAAENIVGDLLERYLNAKGWGWRMHIMGPCPLLSVPEYCSNTSVGEKT